MQVKLKRNAGLQRLHEGMQVAVVLCAVSTGQEGMQVAVVLRKGIGDRLLAYGVATRAG